MQYPIYYVLEPSGEADSSTPYMYVGPENSPANRNAVVRVVHLVSKLFVKNPVYKKLYFSSFEIGCAIGAHALGAGAKAQPDRLAERCA